MLMCGTQLALHCVQVRDLAAPLLEPWVPALVGVLGAELTLVSHIGILDHWTGLMSAYKVKISSRGYFSFFLPLSLPVHSVYGLVLSPGCVADCHHAMTLCWAPITITLRCCGVHQLLALSYLSCSKLAPQSPACWALVTSWHSTLRFESLAPQSPPRLLGIRFALMPWIVL